MKPLPRKIPSFLLLLLLLLCLLSPSLLLYAAAAAPKVQLSKIDTLTLRNGQMTKGRRVSPIPQLKCVGGDGKGLYEIDVMRCKNMGSDYGDEDVSWACTAEVPKFFKLGSTDVICEGYDNPDDKYVLKGSCGVEYRLGLTDAGYEKYGNSMHREASSGWAVYLFWLIFLGTFCLIIYSAIFGTRRDGREGVRGGRNNPRPWFGGGGGGGGWGGYPGNDPPPPYDYPGSSQPPKYSAPADPQQQWRPGFWSGLAAGAAGSYLANRNRDTRYDRYGMGAGPSRWSDGGGGGGGMFGGGSSSSSSGSSSNSGPRQSTTGFGQTRRR